MLCAVLTHALCMTVIKESESSGAFRFTLFDIIILWKNVSRFASIKRRWILLYEDSGCSLKMNTPVFYHLYETLMIEQSSKSAFLAMFYSTFHMFL